MIKIDMQYYSERLSTCTKEDKIACIPTVIRLMEVHRRMNRDDFEYISELLETEPNRFLRLSLQSLAEGQSSASERLMTAMLLSGNLYGRKFLNAALVIQGIEMIQARYSANITSQLLMTMLGEEAAALCAAELMESDRKHWQQCIKTVDNWRNSYPIPAQSFRLQFDTLCELGDLGIQRLIRETDTTVLSYALMGASENMYQMIFRNISERFTGEVMEEIRFLMNDASLREIRKAQQQIVEISAMLEEQGELVFLKK